MMVKDLSANLAVHDDMQRRQIKSEIKLANLYRVSTHNF